ncbi:MAG: hypothetical protein E6J21_02725, partial [Chloroflexota bacterium]
MDEQQTTPKNYSQPDDSASPSLEDTGHSEAEELEAHVASLRHSIEEANYQYYVKDNSTLTDAEYDELM